MQSILRSFQDSHMLLLRKLHIELYAMRTSRTVRNAHVSAHKSHRCRARFNGRPANWRENADCLPILMCDVIRVMWSIQLNAATCVATPYSVCAIYGLHFTDFNRKPILANLPIFGPHFFLTFLLITSGMVVAEHRFACTFYRNLLVLCWRFSRLLFLLQGPLIRSHPFIDLSSL